jgi:hypothetical protein
MFGSPEQALARTVGETPAGNAKAKTFPWRIHFIVCCLDLGRSQGMNGKRKGQTSGSTSIKTITDREVVLKM